MNIQNGNAACERSLSDNKNIVTSKRTNLKQDTIIGLRRMKEHARECGGAEKVSTLDPEIVTGMKNAHKSYKQRMEYEEKEREKLKV